MNERKEMPEAIPYIAYEGAMARNERLVKRLIICLAICIVLIFASNGAWLWAWMQYDYSSDTVTTTQDGEGVNINTVVNNLINTIPTTI